MGYGAYSDLVVSPYERYIPHPEDVNTLSHWPLQGDTLDSVGSNDWSGTSYYQRINGLEESRTLQALSSRNFGNFSAGTTNIKSVSAITVACWVSINQNPSGNLSICGIRAPGSGSAYNFPWDLGISTSAGVRFFWQSGSKTYQGTVGQPIPAYREWFHLIGTRNAAEDTARCYVNGLLVEEATGLSPWSGGSNQNSVVFFTSTSGSNLNGQMFSCIVKSGYTDDAAALALYNSTIETVG